jgi:hypothetical protein
MKTVYTSLGFALTASAALLPRDQCCFSLTASGGKSGVLGQLGDGQNRVGQTGGLATQQATYCLSNGGLTDSNGRGCILTPPTTQFQCDVGATPTTGFAVNSKGDLTYNGNTQFFACATGDNGGYNIYTTTSSAQTGCVPVTLNTGGKCAAASASKPASSAPPASKPMSSAPAASKPMSSAPAASKPMSSAPPASMPASAQQASAPPAGAQTMTVYSTQYVTVSSCAASGAPPASTPAASKPASAQQSSASPASTAPASATNGKACPAALTGAYQTPHAIIPINKDQPSTSYGTQYNPDFSPSKSTIFTFDVPASYAGKQCSLVFLFPKKSDLQTSDFTTSGSGGLSFDLLKSPAPLSVSYATCPAVMSHLGDVPSAMPGNSYTVNSYACPAGTTQSVLVSSTGGLSLNFFEDWNPSPIGVFITAC